MNHPQWHCAVDMDALLLLLLLLLHRRTVYKASLADDCESINSSLVCVIGFYKCSKLRYVCLCFMFVFHVSLEPLGSAASQMRLDVSLKPSFSRTACIPTCIAASEQCKLSAEATVLGMLRMGA
jgi:hypothetical protein